MDDRNDKLSENVNCSQISVGVPIQSTSSLSSTNLVQADGYNVEDKTMLSNRSSIDSNLSFPSREPSLLNELRTSLENKPFNKLIRRRYRHVTDELETSLENETASSLSTSNLVRADGYIVQDKTMLSNRSSIDSNLSFPSREPSLLNELRTNLENNTFMKLKRKKDEANTNVVAKGRLFSRLKKQELNINFTLGNDSSSSIENELLNDASMNLSRVAASKPLFKRPRSKRISVKFDCNGSVSDDSKASLDQVSLLDASTGSPKANNVTKLRRKMKNKQVITDFTLNDIASDASTNDSINVSLLEQEHCLNIFKNKNLERKKFSIPFKFDDDTAELTSSCDEVSLIPEYISDDMDSTSTQTTHPKSTVLEIPGLTGTTCVGKQEQVATTDVSQHDTVENAVFSLGEMSRTSPKNLSPARKTSNTNGSVSNIGKLADERLGSSTSTEALASHNLESGVVDELANNDDNALDKMLSNTFVPRPQCTVPPTRSTHDNQSVNQEPSKKFVPEDDAVAKDSCANTVPENEALLETKKPQKNENPNLNSTYVGGSCVSVDNVSNSTSVDISKLTVATTGFRRLRSQRISIKFDCDGSSFDDTVNQDSLNATSSDSINGKLMPPANSNHDEQRQNQEPSEQLAPVGDTVGEQYDEVEGTLANKMQFTNNNSDLNPIIAKEPCMSVDSDKRNQDSLKVTNIETTNGEAKCPIPCANTIHDEHSSNQEPSEKSVTEGVVSAQARANTASDDEAEAQLEKKKQHTNVKSDLNFTNADESYLSLDNDVSNNMSMDVSKITVSKTLFKRLRSQRVSVKFDCEGSSFNNTESKLNVSNSASISGEPNCPTIPPASSIHDEKSNNERTDVVAEQLCASTVPGGEAKAEQGKKNQLTNEKSDLNFINAEQSCTSVDNDISNNTSMAGSKIIMAKSIFKRARSQRVSVKFDCDGSSFDASGNQDSLTAANSESVNDNTFTVRRTARTSAWRRVDAPNKNVTVNLSLGSLNRTDESAEIALSNHHTLEYELSADEMNCSHMVLPTDKEEAHDDHIGNEGDHTDLPQQSSDLSEKSRMLDRAMENAYSKFTVTPDPALLDKPTIVSSQENIAKENSSKQAEQHSSVHPKKCDSGNDSTLDSWNAMNEHSKTCYSDDISLAVSLEDSDKPTAMSLDDPGELSNDETIHEVSETGLSDVGSVNLTKADQGRKVNETVNVDFKLSNTTTSIASNEVDSFTQSLLKSPMHVNPLKKKGLRSSKISIPFNFSNSTYGIIGGSKGGGKNAEDNSPTPASQHETPGKDAPTFGHSVKWVSIEEAVPRVGTDENDQSGITSSLTQSYQKTSEVIPVDQKSSSHPQGAKISLRKKSSQKNGVNVDFTLSDTPLSDSTATKDSTVRLGKYVNPLKRRGSKNNKLSVPFSTQSISLNEDSYNMRLEVSDSEPRGSYSIVDQSHEIHYADDDPLNLVVTHGDLDNRSISMKSVSEVSDSKLTPKSVILVADGKCADSPQTECLLLSNSITENFIGNSELGGVKGSVTILTQTSSKRVSLPEKSSGNVMCRDNVSIQNVVSPNGKVDVRIASSQLVDNCQGVSANLLPFIPKLQDVPLPSPRSSADTSKVVERLSQDQPDPYCVNDNIRQVVQLLSKETVTKINKEHRGDVSITSDDVQNRVAILDTHDHGVLTSAPSSTDSRIQPSTYKEGYNSVHTAAVADSCSVAGAATNAPLSSDVCTVPPSETIEVFGRIQLASDDNHEVLKTSKENINVDPPLPPSIIVGNVNQQTPTGKLPKSKRKSVSFKPAHQNLYHSPPDYACNGEKHNSSASTSRRRVGGRYDEFSRIQMTSEISDIETSVRLTRSKKHYSSTPLPKPKKHCPASDSKFLEDKNFGLTTIRREAKQVPVTAAELVNNEFLVPPPYRFATKPDSRLSSGGPLNPVYQAEPTPKEGKENQATGKDSSASERTSVDLSYENSLNISAIPKDQTGPKWGNVFHSTPKHRIKKSKKGSNKKDSSTDHPVEEDHNLVNKDRSLNTSRNLRSRSRQESLVSKSGSSSQTSDQSGNSDQSSLLTESSSRSSQSRSNTQPESPIGSTDSPQPVINESSSGNTSSSRISIKDNTVLSTQTTSHSRARDFASSKSSRSSYLTRGSSYNSYDSHRKLPSRRLFSHVGSADEKESDNANQDTSESLTSTNVSEPPNNIAVEGPSMAELLDDDANGDQDVASVSSRQDSQDDSVVSSGAYSVAAHIVPHDSLRSQIDSLRRSSRASSVSSDGSEVSSSMRRHLGPQNEQNSKSSAEPKKLKSKFSRKTRKENSENNVIFNKMPKRPRRRPAIKASENVDNPTEWSTKPRKLFKPGKWASKKLYNWLEQKLKPGHGLRATLMAEKVVIELQHSYLMVTTGHFDGALNLLRELTVESGLCTTQLEFWSFIHKSMPFDFRMKVIPMGGALGLPIAPRTLPYDAL